MGSVMMWWNCSWASWGWIYPSLGSRGDCRSIVYSESAWGILYMYTSPLIHRCMCTCMYIPNTITINIRVYQHVIIIAWVWIWIFILRCTSFVQTNCNDSWEERRQVWGIVTYSGLVWTDCVTLSAWFQVCVEGRDQEDHPFSFLKSVTFSGADPDIRCDQEPYTVLTRAGAALQVNIAFHSHYGEPPLMLKFDITEGEHCDSIMIIVGSLVYLLLLANHYLHKPPPCRRISDSGSPVQPLHWDVGSFKVWRGQRWSQRCRRKTSQCQNSVIKYLFVIQCGY